MSKAPSAPKVVPDGPAGSAKHVGKRCGRSERLELRKLVQRLEKLCVDPQCGAPIDTTAVDPRALAERLFENVKKLRADVKTVDLDAELVSLGTSLGGKHPGYADLAARVAVSALHKSTQGDYVRLCQLLQTNRRTDGVLYPVLSATYMAAVSRIEAERPGWLQSLLVQSRDYGNLSAFGVATLRRSYLLKCSGVVVEPPQMLYLRVAVALWGTVGTGPDYERLELTYELLSTGSFTHASPTLFSAGTVAGQLSSCFLSVMRGDSIEGIFETLMDQAIISKKGGGVGLAVSDIRAKGSPFSSSGVSDGLVPMLKVFNDTAKYANQGNNKRPGAFAIYLEPWHADVYEFLELKKPTGAEELRSRDLFYAMWMPDLYFRRLEAGGTWSLMCPASCPGLADVWGKDFDALYERYEREGRFVRQVPAGDLWAAILDAQTEAGTPYVLSKDAFNRKSNYQNVGTIKCSNLCTEIGLVASKEATSVCNLATINLRRFIDPRTRTCDYARLRECAIHVTYCLNRVIDVTHYPTPAAERGNTRDRPLGIGVQGFADALHMQQLGWKSPGAAEFNERAFEAIYHGALSASCELARLDGAYASYDGSPASRGQLQFDLWGERPWGGQNWRWLYRHIQEHGLRNGVLLAQPPTASTAQILGSQEGVEAYTTNLGTRRTSAGEFLVPNRHLQEELLALGLWDNDVYQQLLRDGGSVQAIACVPDDLKERYRTVWELGTKVLVDMDAGRGKYICQASSSNRWIANADPQSITSTIMYAWRKGCKTLMYYLRSKPASKAAQFSLGSAAASAATMLGGAPVAAGAPKPGKKVAPMVGVDDSDEAVEAAEAAVLATEGGMCVMEEGCVMCSA